MAFEVAHPRGIEHELREPELGLIRVATQVQFRIPRSKFRVPSSGSIRSRVWPGSSAGKRVIPWAKSPTGRRRQV